MEYKKLQQWAKEMWKYRYKLADAIPTTYRNPMKENARRLYNKPWGMLTKPQKRIAKVLYNEEQNGK